MSDKMYPTPMKELTRWVFEELGSHDSIFGLPVELFFKAWSNDSFSTSHAGHKLETPVGVAAGPHTQLAQNIVAAYLMGARFIELKTVQPLDTIEVSKPCIDMQDLGYNCEWSQELRLRQSWDEYVKAWILVRLLRQELGLNSGPEDGFAFNMSVGYDLAGIKGQKVQGFIEVMEDSSLYIEKYLEQAAFVRPSVLDVHMPRRISNSVTLSTMHGCPSDEIERIGQYLIGDLGLNTAIKLNPTLLGPQQLREILNGELGFDDVHVPDAAFEHDPEFSDAIDIISSLRAAADRAGVNFWVKLTNTLETVNVRKVLPASEQMHYMSGRALHPLAIQLAANLQEQFDGQLDISFSGGTDAFNLPDLIAGGLNPVTVCSDLLRPGGYGRLAQYMENLSDHMTSYGTANSLDYTWKRACEFKLQSETQVQLKSRLSTLLEAQMLKKLWPALLGALDVDSGDSLTCNLHQSCDHVGLDHIQRLGVIDQVRRFLAQRNLALYAKHARADERYKRPRRLPSTKTSRILTPFDCISAPCQDKCPTSQNVPDYMFLVANNRVAEAMDVVLRDNPMPYTTGTVCDHTCTSKCVRVNYDQPLDIRGIKGFIARTTRERAFPEVKKRLGKRVVVLGAGPAGLSASWYLALAGFEVVVFDESETLGGVPARIIPDFRLPRQVLEGDIEYLQRAGIDFRFGVELGRDKTLEQLRSDFDYVFLGLGALDGISLGIQNEHIDGVFDCLDFLSKLKSGTIPQLGKSVIVVGGGNSAMDAARAAASAIGSDGKVTLVYRRTQRQMPADDEELQGAIDDGVQIMELTQPVELLQEARRVSGVKCIKMTLGKTDSSGRPRPIAVDGSQMVLEADSVIVAVGQKPRRAWLSGSMLKVDSQARLQVNHDSGETNLPGVFAGGDVIRGASSIIQAVADAKKAAEHIVQLEGYRQSDEPCLDKEIDARVHLVRRMKRVFRPRMGQTMAAVEAQTEADRCLACDEYCSICVSVCPNRANLTYNVQPLDIHLPTFLVSEGKLLEQAGTHFKVCQDVQVLNLADMCNECGNCETFCPTAGAPYRDKPRLCFSKESFAGQKTAYRLSLESSGWKMEFVNDGQMHVLTKHDGQLQYSADAISAVFSGELKLESCQAGPGAAQGDKLDLDTCAAMFVLARALTADWNFLPYCP